MKKIVLFGAGKSATTLINFLATYCEENQHQFQVCDREIGHLQSKFEKFKYAESTGLDVTVESQRQSVISQADLVISLLPPSLHILVARDCLKFYKNLLTASYVDEPLLDLADEIKRRDILFISEMGLDPGIDHMSAMHIIDRLKAQGASIRSFFSHCGGLVSPESDDNPWHYKITWNPRNVVMAGNAGAKYLENKDFKEVGYKKIFSCPDQLIEVPEVGTLAWYANRDSISYLKTYGLEGLDTFIRTTLRYPSYIKAWNIFVQANMTSAEDKDFVSACNSLKDWTERKLAALASAHPDHPVLQQILQEETKAQFEFLGLYDESEIPSGYSSADILLSLLETRLKMAPDDKDMIIMVHEVEYEIGSKKEKLTSSLVVKGTDSRHTAMAKTVGTPLALGAKLILEGKIKITGLHIPVIPEIYNPILSELAQNGIAFKETIE